MDKLFSKLRIGEKIGLGFALVGLLFVGAVWHYHQTLASVLGDYHQLQGYELRKSLALEIEIELAAVRDAEKSFLIDPQDILAAEVDKHLQTLDKKMAALAMVDRDSRQTAGALQGLLTTYRERFQAVADAWKIMGLDENSGLQGAFRDKVHRLQALAANRPQTMALSLTYNESLAHRIEAAADLFLMPSLFEPCGLNQLYSLRYGTLPVVRRVGGLADTVVDTDADTLRTGSATGFVFEQPTPEALLQAARRAIDLWHDTQLWRQVQLTAMAQDFSWQQSAARYLALYGFATDARGDN